MALLPTLAAGALLVALIIYALTGGADFGGGVWDLLASGPRRDGQRALVAQAIGPIWEMNHVWLVVAVVILFTGFPRAFAAIATALFVPLSLILAGIVLRGGAFSFYSYHLHGRDGGYSRWRAVFAGASLLTPVFLGIAIGALSTGDVRAGSVPAIAPPSAWLAPFPVSVGLLAPALFSYLAAVYLILETDIPGLREDFRLRALWTARAVALLAVAVAVLAGREAPEFQSALLESPWSAPVLVLAAASAVGSYVSLHLRSFGLARACAVALVSLILLGWGLAQFPFLVRPDVTLASSAAAPITLRLMLLALAAGAVALFPAIFYLLRVFKREALFGKSAGRRDGF